MALSPHPTSTNARWLGLLILTALAVVVGESLTQRGASQVAEEQRLLSHELRLQAQISRIANKLSEAELCQAAYVGTGRTDYAQRFRRLRETLEKDLRELRPPGTLVQAQQQRFTQLPEQARAYLGHLEHTATLREAQRLPEAFAALQASQKEGSALQASVSLVQESSQRESRLREQSLRLDNQRQRAEAIGRAALFTLALLGAYLILRVERRLQIQRLRTLQKENERLRELTEEDGLTGLSNRRAFDSRLDMEWQRARRYKLPLSVVVLDVDSFKSYNDTFGHPAGDVILRRMASALAQTARLSDTVARYGGEEFSLILPHTDSTEAMIVGERLRALLLRSEWPNRPVTASIGLATLTDSMTSPDGLVGAADSALYFAKEHGRNQVVHWDSVGSTENSGSRA
ncbi:diguanylate cyclase [Armatimonas sp.]|uniref:sensor domain-containing diguanylate cyclase n=1 Tax=Armatimonas sp. TaxID=1872638 RepID=UPI00286A2865|nr:diguanylate cyclase [Armatimonas sp.]